jgi:hypothetical protein
MNEVNKNLDVLREEMMCHWKISILPSSRPSVTAFNSLNKLVIAAGLPSSNISKWEPVGPC